MRVDYMLKEDFIKVMVAEDIGRGDLFARVSTPKEITSYVLAKSEGVFGGREYIEVFSNLFDLEFNWLIDDGDSFKSGDILFEVSSKDSRDLLSLERSILDIALHASGIATMTSKFVKRISKYECKLLDTRKTRPMLREFEKYAVRCGGGFNHRMGLDDCLMLKDTHLKTIDDLDSFMKQIRKKIPFTAKIEIECEDIDMVKLAMRVGADIVMCDNMSIEAIKDVVAFRDKYYPHILLEASGNITLDKVEDVASTGVDAISSGSIIHQATWPDLSMKVK